MSEIIQVVPPLTQAVIDTKTGLPTKAMADFMHQLSVLASVPDPATTEKITSMIERFDGTDASLKTLTDSMLELADELQASVLEFKQTTQNETESLAQKIKLLTAALNSNKAAILDVQSSRVIDSEALATKLGAMTTVFEGNIATVLELTTTLSTADEALAQQITSLSATVESNTAGITTEATARANADEALASDISTLSSTVGDNAAAITAEATARATADSTIASNVATLSSTVGEHTTTLTEFAATIDGITGTWGVQVDVNGRVTGIQLIGTEATSEFIINADVIINGSLTTPKIASNAVTAPLSASGGTSATTASYSFSESTSVAILAYGHWALSSPGWYNEDCWINVYRDSTLLGSFHVYSIFRAGATCSPIIPDVASPGVHTYSVSIGGWAPDYCAITVLILKR